MLKQVQHDEIRVIVPVSNIDHHGEAQRAAASQIYICIVMLNLFDLRSLRSSIS